MNKKQDLQEWQNILRKTKPTLLLHTIAKEKLAQAGLIRNTTHTVQNEAEFWQKFEI